MRLPRSGAALVVFAVSSASSAVYVPLREYSGRTFFDGWDFWGNVDNTTWEWPHAGEIDIIEGINLQNNNQYALHADAGCAQAAHPLQSGHTLEGDCSIPRGCIVAENKPGSYGRGFAEAGGGVYAVQLDIAGVFIWFWSRPDVPDMIRTATSTTNMDVAAFGVPSAAYPASGCNITQYFGPQQLVLLTTLCGSWAGVPSIYSSTCPGQCIADNIFGPGSPTYDNAYWEIPYIRTYIAEDLAPSLPPPSSSSSELPSPSPSSEPSISTSRASPTPTGGTNIGKNGAARVGEGVLGVVAAVLGAAYVLRRAA
ncbi:hypothetical protein DXG03_001819 [Asterophora parasitica]|uniref:Glycoside hydrolase family 16 protein n=1 Tax=Asterophora parasitica TaxID=117018 RepID=A0A9P7K915_9AGAR|nr:hypothetical protein DXG03_001819 [Asterophora parasitica]